MFSSHGELIAIPSRYAYVTVADDHTCHGLRWQVYGGTKCMLHTKKVLEGIKSIGKPALFTEMHQKILDLCDELLAEP